jgi:hypothetical protein
MRESRPRGGGFRLVHGNERGNGYRAGQDPTPYESPVPGVDSAGRPNQCGA